FGKTRLGETGRYKTKFVRYKSYHSKNCLNTNFNWFRYIFRIGVMALGIPFGEEFKIYAEGLDEEEALQKLEETLIKEGLVKL
ncbi:HPr family phosphocarrier protein, partial [Lysinibacillus mangiferihumi]